MCPLCPQSARSGRVLVPGPFLVRDIQQERHFGFSLAQALRRARSHPLLQVTVPNCPQPSPTLSNCPQSSPRGPVLPTGVPVPPPSGAPTGDTAQGGQEVSPEAT